MGAGRSTLGCSVWIRTARTMFAMASSSALVMKMPRRGNGGG